MKKTMAVAIAVFAGLSMVGLAACKKAPAHTAHTYGAWETTKSATCGEAGIKERVCSECGQKEAETIPATGEHVYGAWQTVQNANCTENGLKERICGECGRKETDTVSATGLHDYGEWNTIKEAGCTEAGLRERLCSDCGDKVTENIPAMHLHSENGTCPDCGAQQLTYTLHDDKTFTVVMSEDGKKSAAIEIPAVHEGTAVGHIGSKAFADCDYLKSIYIPASITGIMSSAFDGLPALTDIEVADNSEKYFVKSGCMISKSSGGLFVGCNGCEIPTDGSVKKIFNYAFSRKTDIGKIVIPDSVTEIQKYAFLGCVGLTDVTIPNGVTKIDASTFDGCTALENVTLPDSVTVIEQSAFVNCESLKHVRLPVNLARVRMYSFAGCGLTEITIPDSASKVEEGAFKDCPMLTNVTIGKGVSEIGSKAFAACPALPRIELPANVTLLSGYAFENCSRLTDIVIMNDEMGIGNYAFSGTAYYLDEGNWDNGVLYLGKHLIEAKKDFTGECNVKAETTTIAGWAFYERNGLTGVTLPDSLKRIGAYAFYNCKLTSIAIPVSVNAFSNGAFAGCGSLTEIDYNGTSEDWGIIKKYDFWNMKTGNYTVRCTDTTLTKSQSE